MGALILIGLVAVSGAATLVGGVWVQFGAGFGLIATGAALLGFAALLRLAT